MIIKDKKLKRKLDKVPDRDKNGEPIYKIDNTKSDGNKANKGKSGK